jgi:tetrahydromethanopterin S-methyltransferase subunit B
VDENRDDKPLSSEELLRRAREGLGATSPSYEPGSAEAADSGAARSSTEPPPPDSVAGIEMEPVYEDEDEVAAVPTFETSSPPDAMESWPAPAVEPEPQNGWVSSGGPAPSPVKRTESPLRKLWRFRGIIIIAIIAGVALFSFLDKTKSVDEIAVGDCFNWPEDDVFFEIDPISCNATHDIEVYANIDLAAVDTSYSTVAAYPGDQEVYQAALDACLGDFEPYVGLPYDQSVLYIDAFTPTEEGWNEVDDRMVNCVLFQVNDDVSAIAPSSQSMRNAQR